MAKKSRRQRKLEREKQIQSPSAPQAVVAQTPVADIPTKSEVVTTSVSKAASSRKTTVNLGQAYYYVYTDVRNILLITVVMFGVLFGLSNFI